MQLLFNHIMRDLTQTTKSSTKQPHKLPHKYVADSYTIGYAYYERLIPDMSFKKRDDLFLDQLITSTPEQIQKSFNRQFPFLMRDLIQLKQRLQRSRNRNFSFIRNMKKLESFYQKSNKFMKILKRLFKKGEIVDIQQWNFKKFGIQTQNFQHYFRLIFKKMFECSIRELYINLLEVNVLKSISHVRMGVLKTLIIKNSPIQSLQPIIWMDLPCLEIFYINVLYTTSIKPIGHCAFSNLTCLKIDYNFEYSQSRFWNTKISVEIKPLWRTRLNKQFKKHSFIRSIADMLPFDARDLVKLEWPEFIFPIQQRTNKRLITFNLTQKQTQTVKRRSKCQLNRNDVQEIQEFQFFIDPMQDQIINVRNNQEDEIVLLEEENMENLIERDPVLTVEHIITQTMDFPELLEKQQRRAIRESLEEFIDVGRKKVKTDDYGLEKQKCEKLSEINQQKKRINIDGWKMTMNQQGKNMQIREKSMGITVGQFEEQKFQEKEEKEKFQNIEKVQMQEKKSLKEQSIQQGDEFEIDNSEKRSQNEELQEQNDESWQPQMRQEQQQLENVQEQLVIEERQDENRIDEGQFEEEWNEEEDSNIDFDYEFVGPALRIAAGLTHKFYSESSDESSHIESKHH